MRRYGIVVRPNVLDQVQVSELRGIVDRAIDETETALREHRPDIHIGQDCFSFREMCSRNQQRFDLRLDVSVNDNNEEDPTEMPVAVKFVHSHILSNPQVRSFLTEVLVHQHTSNDEDCEERDLEQVIDFDVGVVYSRPGATTQGWHADGRHIVQASNENADANKPYAVCLFVPLIDLDETVGYTQFWPGSHRSKELVGFGKIAELTRATYNAIGKAGSGIWYDYRLLHQGMPNKSNSVLRPVVQVIFKHKWYVERANYGKDSVRR